VLGNFKISVWLKFLKSPVASFEQLASLEQLIRVVYKYTFILKRPVPADLVFRGTLDTFLHKSGFSVKVASFEQLLLTGLLLLSNRALLEQRIKN
jgi:hypothetical protein